jgi:hypothetical protein
VHEKIERENLARKTVVFAVAKNASLASLNNDSSSALQEGKKKANPREAHNLHRTNRTAAVVLPSPRSLFSSIERRPDCRFLSTAGQRNQTCQKQTIMIPYQIQSIRQHDVDVNGYGVTNTQHGIGQRISTSDLNRCVVVLL